ncbi:hypothetical protein Asi03nite_00290 [Actinoplanes siamensis]|uniref:Uncharacterized protein n=1 Tax=Actinoplanes siamensis TaxID=1223317 RepID=A0A919KBJ5_9ACTN|nr:hypothetical protein Asi03nite_00290 [Actinoplanes siamensis]
MWSDSRRFSSQASVNWVADAVGWGCSDMRLIVSVADHGAVGDLPVAVDACPVVGVARSCAAGAMAF